MQKHNVCTLPSRACTHCARLLVARYGMCYLLDRVAYAWPDEKVDDVRDVYGTTYKNLFAHERTVDMDNAKEELARLKHAARAAATAPQPAEALLYHPRRGLYVPEDDISLVSCKHDMFSMFAAGYDVCDTDHLPRADEIAVNAKVDDFANDLVLHELQEFRRKQSVVHDDERHTINIELLPDVFEDVYHEALNGPIQAVLQVGAHAPRTVTAASVASAACATVAEARRNDKEFASTREAAAAAAKTRKLAAQRRVYAAPSPVNAHTRRLDLSAVRERVQLERRAEHERRVRTQKNKLEPRVSFTLEYVKYINDLLSVARERCASCVHSAHVDDDHRGEYRSDESKSCALNFMSVISEEEIRDQLQWLQRHDNSAPKSASSSGAAASPLIADLSEHELHFMLRLGAFERTVRSLNTQLAEGKLSKEQTHAYQRTLAKSMIERCCPESSAFYKRCMRSLPPTSPTELFVARLQCGLRMFDAAHKQAVKAQRILAHMVHELFEHCFVPFVEATAADPTRSLLRELCEDVVRRERRVQRNQTLTMNSLRKRALTFTGRRRFDACERTIGALYDCAVRCSALGAARGAPLLLSSVDCTDFGLDMECSKFLCMHPDIYAVAGAWREYSKDKYTESIFGCACRVEASAAYNESIERSDGGCARCSCAFHLDQVTHLVDDMESLVESNKGVRRRRQRELASSMITDPADDGDGDEEAVDGTLLFTDAQWARIGNAQCNGRHDDSYARAVLEMVRKLVCFSDVVVQMACVAATVGHHVLCHLQPFHMRNGATARFLCNAVLEACNLPPMVFRDALNQIKDEQMASHYNQYVAAALRDNNLQFFHTHLQKSFRTQMLGRGDEFLYYTDDFAAHLGLPLNHCATRMRMLAKVVQRGGGGANAVDGRRLHAHEALPWGFESYTAQHSIYTAVSYLCDDRNTVVHKETANKAKDDADATEERIQSLLSFIDARFK